MAWPSGSRTVSDLRGTATAPGEMKANFPANKLFAAPSASRVVKLVCHCQRSFACESGGEWATIAGREVFEKLDRRASRSAQAGNMQPRAKNVIEMLLFSTVVLAFARHFEPQRVPVKFQAGLRIPDDDGGVVDAEKQSVRRLVPLRIALVRREPQNFEVVTIRVTEVEGKDASGTFVPVGNSLRTGRGKLDVVLAQTLVGLVHITNDDRDMLKPMIVAARVDGNRAALGSQILNQLNMFVAQLHPDHAGPRPEH